MAFSPTDSFAQGYQQVLSPHHVRFLQSAWDARPAIPTVASRQAWAKAHDLPPVVVHKFFWKMRSQALRKDLYFEPEEYELQLPDPPLRALASDVPPLIPATPRPTRQNKPRATKKECIYIKEEPTDDLFPALVTDKYSDSSKDSQAASSTAYSDGMGSAHTCSSSPEPCELPILPLSLSLVLGPPVDFSSVRSDNDLISRPSSSASYLSCTGTESLRNEDLSDGWHTPPLSSSPLGEYCSMRDGVRACSGREDFVHQLSTLQLPPRFEFSETVEPEGSGVSWPPDKLLDAKLSRLEQAFAESGLAAFIELERAGLSEDTQLELPWISAWA